MQDKGRRSACSAVVICCMQGGREGQLEVAGNWGEQRHSIAAATGLQEGADAIMGSSGPLDADTQMGRAAESLREGAEAIEAPAAGIEMQQQAPLRERERELAAKHGQW